MIDADIGVHPAILVPVGKDTEGIGAGATRDGAARKGSRRTVRCAACRAGGYSRPSSGLAQFDGRLVPPDRCLDRLQADQGCAKPVAPPAATRRPPPGCCTTGIRLSLVIIDTVRYARTSALYSAVLCSAMSTPSLHRLERSDGILQTPLQQRPAARPPALPRALPAPDRRRRPLAFDRSFPGSARGPRRL